MSAGKTEKGGVDRRGMVGGMDRVPAMADGGSGQPDSLTAEVMCRCIRLKSYYRCISRGPSTTTTKVSLVTITD